VASPPILPVSADAGLPVDATETPPQHSGTACSGSRAPRVTMTGPLVRLRPSPCQP
jgi:hypothetical protein